MSLTQRESTGVGSRYIAGDTDPEDTSLTDPITKDEALVLLLRNGKIRKATSWVAREAIRPRFIMKTEKQIVGTKHNKPYIFPTILEYLEWIGFFTEVEKAVTWYRLFGTSIMVLFKEGEEIPNMFMPLPAYDSVRAYHPLANGSGYQILSAPQNSWYYDISFKDELNNTKTYKVHKDRVITMNAPHLELTFAGSSCVEPILKVAKIQEQMLCSVLQRLHFMGAGILTINVANAEEQSIVEAAIKKSVKYLNVIYTTDKVENTMKVDVPDLKPAQFREFWDIMQEEIANGSNMSKKLISGDPQGTISSAQWDTEISYTEVYQTQRHSKKDIESILYKLGIEDTTFQWNDPFPTEEKDQSNTNKEGNTNDRTRKQSEPSRSE
jgi:hypothetical protein